MSSQTLDTSTTALVAQPRAGSSRLRWWRTALRYPLGSACGVYLILLIAAVVAAPLLAPHNPNTLDLGQALGGPNATHWLGSDQLGRDVLSRLLFGGRTALLDVVVAVATLLVVSIPVGLLAGYLGGMVDTAIVRVCDLILATPSIIVMLMVVAIFPANDVAAMITLGLLHAPSVIRIIRASTISARGELFVRAAELSGLRSASVLRRHLLPSLMGPIIVQSSLFFAAALVVQSGLSFLGLLRPETSGPTWGNMVAEASHVSSQDPWLLVPTGGILAITVVACSLLGDAVRDATMGRSVPPVALRSARRRRASVSARPVHGAGVLEVRGLTVSLRRREVDTTVVSDVSFTLESGECIGIVGESGCGKSTTIKAILGLLPAGGQVVSGSVLFENEDLTTLSDQALSRVRGAGIALVSQDPLNSLDPVYTVESQLREVIRWHTKLSRAEADARAVELLRMVRFPDPELVLRRRAHELSGGMAQRVGIALALAGSPKVLIADEPTSALDVTVQAEILALLRDLRAQLGMAVIIVTHDWGVLADVCDRTLVMYAGQVVETGTVEQVYERPAHPYSDALLASYPGLALRGEPLPTIAGTVPPPDLWPEGCRFADRCPLVTKSCRGVTVPLITVSDDHASRCLRIDELVGVA